MIRHLLATVSLSCVFIAPALAAREIPIADPSQFASAAAATQPGEVLVLAAGEWKDARLKLKATGTAKLPVVVRAQTPGATIFTGDSRISISGAHITVEGLHFKNPTGEEVIELRTKSDALATDCRVTQCAVTNELPGSKSEGSARFVSIYGARNRIDHCLIQGKTSAGTTVVVWLSDEAKDQGHHRIDHNYFGPRERLGKNGGETIRLGDSKISMQRAECVVENNVFERCDGEAECISNKSCGNLYQHNTFLSVAGTITLRHGNDCTVQNNVFLGRGVKGTGGIRVIGERNRVIGNHLEGLRGTEERSAICFMLGIPDSPANGYFQVKDAVIERNTIVDCTSPMVIGVKGEKKASLPPVGVRITGNSVVAPNVTAIDARCDITSIRWADNTMEAKSLGIPPIPGITEGPTHSTKPDQVTSREEVGPGWWK